MRILTAGGGSGGHVTPVVAVLRELKTVHPEAEYRFWCDKGFSEQARRLMYDAFGESVQVSTVISGKLRRYHTMSIWRQLGHPFTIVLPNIIDSIKVACGTLQSLWRLVIWRPDVVFAKGGFVCLPIGLAAHLLNIPLVIHDSDAHPGLTNRILSRWAKVIATGAPLKYYSYPADRAYYVGHPVDATLTPPTSNQQAELKSKLGFSSVQPLVLVTGGGLGAVRINNAVAEVLPSLLEQSSVALICGRMQYTELRERLGEDTAVFQLHDFVSNMHEFMAASDVVVSRAGMAATTELAALARPTILIPNALLTGGHQLKNASVYADAEAVRIVDESHMQDGMLLEAIGELLASRSYRLELGQRFQTFARPHAAQDIARMILEAGNATIKKTK